MIIPDQIPWILILNENKQFGEALEPGANPPVDEFPFLKYLPEFLAPWKVRARHAGRVMHQIWGEARKRVDDRRALGDVRNFSLVDKLLDEYAVKGTPLTKDELDHYFGLLVEGMAETTSSSILTTILCLAMNPRVQEKARKELDALCGTDR
jgi:cytochrome P450